MPPPAHRSPEPPRRRRRRAFCLGIPLALVALAGACSVSVTPPVVWRLVDAEGRPVAGAWAAYHVRGDRFNPVDSASFAVDGRVVRVGDDGVLRIGRGVHLHAPWPLAGGMETFVDLVYVPSLHHAFGPVARLTDDRVGPPLGIDRASGTIVVHDLAADPEAWEESLRWLHSLVRYELLPGLAGEREPPYDVDPATLRELAEHVAAELDALVARHGATPYPHPAGGAATWGDHLERMWRRDAEELRERVAELDRRPR